MRWIAFFVLLAAFPVAAQESPVVTADTVLQLAPVVQIDFENVPAEAGEIFSGGFAMDPAGQFVAVRNRDNGIVVFTSLGELVDVYSVPGADGLPDTVLDSVFDRTGTLLASIVSDGAAYSVAIRAISDETTTVLLFPFSPDIPLRVWFDAEAPYYWVEVSPSDPGESAYLVRLSYAPLVDSAVEAEPLIVPFAPDRDPDTFARFGRINAPYAVTATQAGWVTVWNLEQGEAVGQAQVDGLPVFGGLNRDGSALAWRDPDYQVLHLLNLSSGEDRLVAPLDGTYINYMLVPPSADTILGVHVGEEAIVSAWDVETGERTDLGAYRQCERTPDMARLSGNAQVLVIGCDTGIDIWRVVDAD